MDSDLSPWLQDTGASVSCKIHPSAESLIVRWRTMQKDELFRRTTRDDEKVENFQRKIKCLPSTTPTHSCSSHHHSSPRRFLSLSATSITLRRHHSSHPKATCTLQRGGTTAVRVLPLQRRVHRRLPALAGNPPGSPGSPGSS